jgi:hypothetical protein
MAITCPSPALKIRMLSCQHEKEFLFIPSGGNMDALNVFWFFVTAMLVVFGVDIFQHRRKSR